MDEDLIVNFMKMLLATPKKDPKPPSPIFCLGGHD